MHDSSLVRHRCTDRLASPVVRPSLNPLTFKSTPPVTCTSFAVTALVAVLTLVCPVIPTAAVPPPVRSHESHWHQDYSSARQKAIANRQLLGIVFHQSSLVELERWQSDLLQDPQVLKHFSSYTWAALPLGHLHVNAADEVVFDESNGRTRLIDHPSFSELQGRSGIAIVDLRDANSPQFRQVVSILPSDFPSPATNAEQSALPSPALLAAVMDLPSGTLTERTLVLALRTHPEHPQSASGTPHPHLRAEAARHARLQAQLGRQGHHDWERRFADINLRLPQDFVAQEVCAESWSGQGLVAAALECVRSWRQSPGHWNAISARHYSYGFDMQRGANGVWYAAGILARRR